MIILNKPMPKKKFENGGIVLPMNRGDIGRESGEPEMFIPLNRGVFKNVEILIDGKPLDKALER